MAESVVNRVGFGILAVSLWTLGLGAIAGGGFYDRFYSAYFDFGEHHVIVGVALLALGTWSGYAALRRLATK